MWGCLQRIDQQLSGTRPLEAFECIRIDDHNGLAPMQGNVLWTIVMGEAHKFTEPRLGVLKTPYAARGLRGRCRLSTLFTSHAD